MRRHHWFAREMTFEKRAQKLMTCHYSDLGSASDWLKQISLAARPIRITTPILVVSRHMGRRRGQRERQKSNRFNNQDNKLHVDLAFLYISLPSLHDYLLAQTSCPIFLKLDSLPTCSPYYPS